MCESTITTLNLAEKKEKKISNTPPATSTSSSSVAFSMTLISSSVKSGSGEGVRGFGTDLSLGTSNV